MDDERNWMYNTRNGADRRSPVGGWVKLWMHWAVRGADLRPEVPTSVEMLFSCCTEE